MKRHIDYIVYEVSPCKLSELYREVLPFFNETDAEEFINTYYSKYDFSNRCLVLMKVLA